MKAIDRQKFRESDEWKNFRNELIAEQKIDIITGDELEPTCNLHHCRLDHNRYNDISDKYAFVCLNKDTHTLVHEIYNTGVWKKEIERITDPKIKQNLTDLFERMDLYNTNRIRSFSIFSTYRLYNC